ncbi:ABC transporter permease [Yinghuangia seranimata]|uniref:ABC transporter permease n=1 Tax=Yinghuangia seranimata TaxID=408067 RepID=UPI00248B304B|nr:ABC transporter permease [Yinghuangia seranimata]MDI2132669.1 ABC transporter permease [Yinghuangia seranimata]
MLRLAIGTLRTRVGGFVGAFLAVALAAVLVTAAGVMLESALRTHGKVERLSGTDLAVAGSAHLARTPAMGKPPADSEMDPDALRQTARVPEEFVPRIAALPGVRAVVPDRTVPVGLPGGGGAEAHGWDSAQLTPYALTAGTAPQSDGQAVVDARTAAALGIAPGARLDLATPTGTHTVTVTGIAEGRGPAAVFLTPAQARSLSATPDRADFLGVQLNPGADRGAVRTAVDKLLKAAGPQFGDPTRPQPRLQVVSGGGLARLEAPAVTEAQEATVPLVSVFGGTAAFAAVFVVAGTFGFSIRQRLREIGLLRAVGATPGQVRRMIASEALLVALAASAVGVPLGYLFAEVLHTLFDQANALPDGFVVRDGWIPGVVGAGTAVLTTQLAALVAAGRAAKVRPTEVFGTTGKRRILVPLLRYTLGLVAVAGGVTLLIVSMHLGGDDGASTSVAIVFTFMLAVALLGLPLARLGVALIGRPLALFGRAPALIARANGAADPGRVSAVATPIALTIAFTCTILFFGSTEAHETVAQSRARTTAGTLVVDGRDGAGLPAGTADRVAALPGVAAVSGTVETTVLDGSAGDAEEQQARGVDPGVGKVLDLGVTEGDVARLTGPGTVALGERRADALGKHAGDRVRFWLGDGTPYEAQVVAVYANAYGFGDYLLPRDVALAHSRVAAYDKVYVAPAPGVDRAALTAALAHEGRVLDRAAYLDEVSAKADEQAWANVLILGAIGLFTALGVVNTTVMAIGARAREFAVLRLSGTTRRQLFAMLRGELAVVVGLGLGLGTLIAYLTLGAFANGIAGSFSPVMPLGTYLVVAGSAVVTTYAAALLAARAVLRRDPVAALGARE